MTKAPERIVTSVCGKQIVQDGMKRFKTDIEWVPVDHALALVAAEREACARKVENTAAWKFYSCAERGRVAKSVRERVGRWVLLSEHDPEAHKKRNTGVYEADDELIWVTSDDLAALDKLLQEARNEALREALEIVWSWHDNGNKPGDFAMMKVETAILALITEDQQDEL